MPIRIVKPAASYGEVRSYRRVRAADLPPIMAPGLPRPHVPLTLLVKEWDYFPDDRAAMIEDEPAGPDPDDLCRIAAVVHALCDRDGVPIPDWVWKHRSKVPIAWDRTCVMRGFIWDRTKERPSRLRVPRRVVRLPVHQCGTPPGHEGQLHGVQVTGLPLRTHNELMGLLAEVDEVLTETYSAWAAVPTTASLGTVRGYRHR